MCDPAFRCTGARPASSSASVDIRTLGSLRRAVEEQLFEWHDLPYDREDAINRLMEFEHDGTRIYTPHDWTLDDWDWQFLWCCWGIVQGIAQYDWTKGWN